MLYENVHNYVMFNLYEINGILPMYEILWKLLAWSANVKI